MLFFRIIRDIASRLAGLMKAASGGPAQGRRPLLMLLAVFMGTQAMAQSDAVFEYVGNNVWQSRDDGIPANCPDDGTIILGSGYSRDFGPGSTVIIKHKIVLDGPSGIGGRNGDGMANQQGGIGSPNGEAGQNGTDGYSFSITADHVNLIPTQYDLCGFIDYVRAGVTSNGGSGGAGGHGGGWWASQGGGCPGSYVVRGTPGEGGVAGNGGSITIDAKSVVLTPKCYVTSKGVTIWVYPILASNGGSGGSSGNSGSTEYGFLTSPVGMVGKAGRDGGAGGTISFGKANVFMCPQSSELFAVDCERESGTCWTSSGQWCETPEEPLALGYMRLPILANGGQGGNGGSGGPGVDLLSWEIACNTYDKACVGSSAAGGKGGNGGGGGSVIACSTHPILFSAGGGNGGQGGMGGTCVDINYSWATTGGNGGAGGSGGATGGGCGAFSETGDGAGGAGGLPGFGLEYYTTDGQLVTICSNGSHGGPAVPAPPPPVYDFADPACGCGVKIEEVELPYRTYQLGTAYAGSYLQGKNLSCQTAGLELYLMQGGTVIRRLYIEPLPEVPCEDGLKFWINRDESGIFHSPAFPASGVYDLFVTNGSCEDTLPGAITITPSGTPSGATCSDPYDIVSCPMSITEGVATGSSVSSCYDSAPYDGIGRWFRLTLQPGASVTVHANTGHAPAPGSLAIVDLIGVAFYSSCPGPGSELACFADIGEVIAPYTNNSGSVQTVRVLVNTVWSGSHPLVEFDCAAFGESCGLPQPLACGQSLRAPGSNTTDRLSIHTASPYKASWYVVTIPAEQRARVTVQDTTDPGKAVSAGFFHTGPAHPCPEPESNGTINPGINKITGTGSVTSYWSYNLTTATLQRYVLINQAQGSENALVTLECEPRPDNDRPCGAFALQSDVAATGKLIDFHSQTPNAFICGGTPASDAWYYIDVPVAGSLVQAVFNHGSAYNGGFLTLSTGDPCTGGAGVGGLTGRACGSVSSYNSPPVSVSWATTQPNQRVYLMIRSYAGTNQSLTATVVPPGHSCANPRQVQSCPAWFDEGVGAGSSVSSCYAAAPGTKAGRWFSMEVQPSSTVNVEASINQAELVSVAFYSGCGAPGSQLSCFMNDVSVTGSYTNTDSVAKTIRILVNTPAQTGHPEVAFTCSTLPGSSCANAYNVACDAVLDWSNPVPGMGTDASPCFSASPVAGRWVKLTVPPHSSQTVTAVDWDLNYYVGIAFYSACGQAPLDCVLDYGGASRTFTNSGSQTQTIYALINTHQSAYHPIVEVTCAQLPPSHDEMAGAKSINCGYGEAGPITTHATASTVPSGNPCGQSGVKDVWYRLQIPAVLPYGDPLVTVTFTDDMYYGIPSSSNHEGFIALYEQDPYEGFVLRDYRCGRTSGVFTMQVKGGQGDLYYIRVGSSSPSDEKSLSIECFSKL